jgi:transposase
LFPALPGSNVPTGHPARRLKDALDAMDLSFLRRRYSHRGGYPYDPLPMLAAVLYGMTMGIRTGRDLEEACRYDDRYKLLAGGHTPDDRTFDRFIEQVGPSLDELLSEVLVLARKHGMGRGNEVAVDGCKVPCSASWWKYGNGSSETPSDPDARLMNSHGRRMVGYNALTAVDTADGLIVGAEVVNDQNDFHAMAPVLEAVLKQLGEAPAAALADSGFDTPSSIQVLENAGVDSVIAARDALYDCFSEDEEGDWACPAGKKLVRKGTGYKSGSLTAYDRYGPEGGCRNCPFKANCPFFKKYLHIPEGTDVGARFRNQARVQSATYHRATVRRRRVETPFAFLRRHDRFERFRGRSLTKAKAEFRLWVASYNLRKIFKAFKNALNLLFALMSATFDPASATERQVLQMSATR